MRFGFPRIGIGLAGVLAIAAAAAVSASATPGLQLVEAGGAIFPQRADILTLATPRALNVSELQVSENGHPVTGLTLERQGSTVASSSAVVIEIDESLSMVGKPLQEAFVAARAFAAQASPDEQIGIVTFNGKVNVVQPLTTSAAIAGAQLSTIPKASYGTKIYDALETGLSLISTAHVQSGSIIILTDGQDVGSTVKPAVALGTLANAHVRVFSVGVHSPSFDPGALAGMASTTGGTFVAATSLSSLTPLLDRIASQLSNEYLLEYRSIVNPGAHATLSVSVQGIPGVASVSYVAPPLVLTPAPPYSPSTTQRVIQSPYVLAFVVLIIAVLLIFALVNLFAQRPDPLLARVGSFVTLKEGAAPEPTKERRQRRRVVRPAQLLERAQRPRSLLVRLNETLELADIDATPLQVVALTLILTVIVAFVGDELVGIIGLLAGIVAVPYLARYFVLTKLKNRRRAFSEQLPDSLDVLASALRAGHSLVSALSVVADDAPEPSATEYRIALTEEQLGLPLEDALNVVVVRMANPDLEQVALVVRLQREMGSNSAEVLDRVIETVRGRVELRRLVRTLTAQGRLSRWILTGLPVALGLFLAIVASGYMHPLFHRTAGELLLGLATVMVVLGSYMIGKIVDIKA